MLSVQLTIEERTKLKQIFLSIQIEESSKTFHTTKIKSKFFFYFYFKRNKKDFIFCYFILNAASWASKLIICKCFTTKP